VGALIYAIDMIDRYLDGLRKAGWEE